MRSGPMKATNADCHQPDGPARGRFHVLTSIISPLVTRMDVLEKSTSDSFRELGTVYPGLIPVCRGFAHAGDAFPQLGLWLLFYFRGNAHRRTWMLSWLLRTLTGIAILYPLRALVRRRRPLGELPREFITTPVQDGWSFPSGHALRNTILVLCLRRAHPRLSPLLYLHLAGVCLARLILGLHWPTDILAGIALGGWLGKERRA